VVQLGRLSFARGRLAAYKKLSLLFNKRQSRPELATLAVLLNENWQRPHLHMRIQKAKCLLVTRSRFQTHFLRRFRILHQNQQCGQLNVLSLWLIVDFHARVIGKIDFSPVFTSLL
jgi:hypothetical protein